MSGCVVVLLYIYLDRIADHDVGLALLVPCAEWEPLYCYRIGLICNATLLSKSRLTNISGPCLKRSLFMSAVSYERKVCRSHKKTLISKVSSFQHKKSRATRLYTPKIQQRARVVLQSRRYGGEARQSGAAAAAARLVLSVRIWGLTKWKCDDHARWRVFHVTSKRQGRRFVGILPTASLFMWGSEDQRCSVWASSLDSISFIIDWGFNCL